MYKPLEEEKWAGGEEAPSREKSPAEEGHED